MPITAGAPYTYTPFPGDQLDPLTLYPWVGEHVAVSTLTSSLSPDVMTRIVHALDAAYEVYAQITGREPVPYVLYDGRLSLAELPDNPSYTFAEHGYLGFTGIEFQQTYFQQLYNDAISNTYDQAPFYELGRNFWFYEDQLGAVDPFVTGFAIANRFVSMEVAGLAGGPFGSMDFSVFKTEVVDGLTATFLSGDGYTLENTLGAGQAVTSTHNWSVADLAGSFLYQVYENSSLNAYSDFYRLLAQEPTASTSAQAFANFVTAATQATGIDFSFLTKPAGEVFVLGADSTDQLLATDAHSVLLGFGGNDTLTADQSGSTLLGGSGDDRIIGANGNDVLAGGLGADQLQGGAGNDKLIGGSGIDKLFGGAGNDTYLVSDATDFAYENAGEGTDTVLASLSASLRANIENLTLTGTVGISGKGNELANVINGNDGANRLSGLAGNDTLVGGGGRDILDGGTGSDTLTGGADNDIYVIDSSTDVIVEAAGEGTDFVQTSASYTLNANVERMYLLGSANIDGTGNDLANLLVGNSGDNPLSGLGANDRFYGGGGMDHINGGDGNDYMEGGTGQDDLIGGTGKDYFVFRDGDTGATAATADRVEDFAIGDRISLSPVDANTNLAGNQAFSFIGTGAFTGVAGQLHYEQISGNTYLSGDTNGDDIADFMIKLDGLHTINASDLIL